MSVSRLSHISKIGVEQMGELADSLSDPEVLRLENLDTDIRPPASALTFTKEAVMDDDANSYLPFFGLDSIRKSATKLVSQKSGNIYNWKGECLISAGGLSGVLNVLLATLEVGDKVLMTDPTYVGLINRVRLAGGIPIFISLIANEDGWRLNTAELAEISTENIRAALIMSPSMPTGAVFNQEEWKAICEFVKKVDAWLIYDAAMERILFDDLSVIHPASFEGMRERTITIGAASKEYRMIGWRVGWIVGPAEIMADVARVSISNVVCQTGIAMGAVTVAIEEENDGIKEMNEELEKRRDLILEELKDFRIIKPHGGWSLFLDVSVLGMESTEASKRLLEKGKIAATPMINWGSENANKYVRFVFSNESLDRLAGIGERVKMALL
ncbi:MAG: pyridoxal phosphate-dependent aminotransferase [Bacteroidota bacterium]